MAKERFDELRGQFEEDPSLRSNTRFLREYNHHYTITQTKKGGRNLYLDEAKRDEIIAKSRTPLEALNELISPASVDNERDFFEGNPRPSNLLIRPSRFLPEDWYGKGRYAKDHAPAFQLLALQEYAGTTCHLRKENKEKLLKLVDNDKHVRDQAWAELHTLLDKHEEKQLSIKRSR